MSSFQTAEVHIARRSVDRRRAGLGSRAASCHVAGVRGVAVPSSMAVLAWRARAAGERFVAAVGPMVVCLVFALAAVVTVASFLGFSNDALASVA